eukprot:COSAG01_NODE_3285_length_6309_cov_2.105153_1_plen_98_part_00
MLLYSRTGFCDARGPTLRTAAVACWSTPTFTHGSNRGAARACMGGSGGGGRVRAHRIALLQRRGFALRGGGGGDIVNAWLAADRLISRLSELCSQQA